MATKDWRTEVRLTVDPDAAAEEPEARGRSAGDPFVVAVLGDFGVAAGRESAVERGPRLVGVDRDNFDALFASLAPRWRGPVPGGESGEAEPPEAEVVFRSLDDFHPDRLVETVPALRALLEARRAVNDPARFEAAAEEVARRFGGKAGATETEEEPCRAATTDAGPARGGGLLDRILEQAEPGRPLARPAPPRDEEFARLLAEIVARIASASMRRGRSGWCAHSMPDSRRRSAPFCMPRRFSPWSRPGGAFRDSSAPWKTTVERRSSCSRAARKRSRVTLAAWRTCATRLLAGC